MYLCQYRPTRRDKPITVSLCTNITRVPLHSPNALICIVSILQQSRTILVSAVSNSLGSILHDCDCISVSPVTESCGNKGAQKHRK
jgi:hypothetical protein